MFSFQILVKSIQEANKHQIYDKIVFSRTLYAQPITLQQLKESYQSAGLKDFELFWDNKPVSGLWKAGLLML